MFKTKRFDDLMARRLTPTEIVTIELSAKRKASKLKKKYQEEEERHERQYKKENTKHEKKHRRELDEALNIGKKRK